MTGVSLVLFCTATLRVLVCFHPSYPCDGMILSAWALPSSKEELPRACQCFSFSAAYQHCWNNAGDVKGGCKVLGWEVGQGIFFALKYEGLYPIEVRQEDGGCSSIVCCYLEIEML